MFRSLVGLLFLVGTSCASTVLSDAHLADALARTKLPGSVAEVLAATRVELVARGFVPVQVAADTLATDTQRSTWSSRTGSQTSEVSYIAIAEVTGSGVALHVTRKHQRGSSSTVGASTTNEVEPALDVELAVLRRLDPEAARRVEAARDAAVAAEKADVDQAEANRERGWLDRRRGFSLGAPGRRRHDDDGGRSPELRLRSCERRAFTRRCGTGQFTHCLMRSRWAASLACRCTCTVASRLASPAFWAATSFRARHWSVVRSRPAIVSLGDREQHRLSLVVPITVRVPDPLGVYPMPYLSYTYVFF